MRITLLGTGTPAPSLHRAGSGYLLEIGDDTIVLDHGPGAHHRLLQSGRSAGDIDYAFFSHLHYDHCVDYPRLVLSRWDMGVGNLQELQVCGPSPIGRMNELLFGPDGVYDGDLTARTHHRCSLDIYEARGGVLPRGRPAPIVHEVRAGDEIQGNGWTARAGEAWHFQPYLECISWRFDCAEESLCYAGDSGGVCDGLVDLATGCDVLIHMNHFISGTEPSAEYRKACGNHLDTATVAARAGVGTLVLTHMTGQIDRPGVREQVIAEMREIFEGTLIWGEDLMEVPIAPVKPARID